MDVESDSLLEARLWMLNNSNRFPIAGNRFVDQPGAALKFVDELYQAGASLVAVSDIKQEDWRIKEQGGPLAGCLIVKLPYEQAKRDQLFAIYNREAEIYGEDFGGAENFHILTKEDAEALGDPSLEGEVVSVGELLKDTGQESIKFWWD